MSEAPVYSVTEPFSGHNNAGHADWYTDISHSAVINFREVTGFNVISLANRAYCFLENYLDTTDSNNESQSSWSYNSTLRWPLQKIPSGSTVDYHNFTDAQQRLTVIVDGVETVVNSEITTLTGYLFYSGTGVALNKSTSDDTTYNDACDSSYCDETNVCMAYSTSTDITYS